MKNITEYRIEDDNEIEVEKVAPAKEIEAIEEKVKEAVHIPVIKKDNTLAIVLVLILVGTLVWFYFDNLKNKDNE